MKAAGTAVVAALALLRRTGRGHGARPPERTGHGHGSVAQTSFAGDVLLRPNGSWVVVGGVSIAKGAPSGSGGASTGYLAVAAFTSVLAPDLGFGGPAVAPVASAVLAGAQTTRFAAARRGIRARLSASSAGLFGVRVSDTRGRVLARSVQGLYGPGTTSPRIPLTRLGRGVLRRARGLRVRVTWDFRDLLAGRSTGAGPARLR